MVFRQRGFTLIELLVVIAIIAALAGGLISLINPETQFKKSRDVKRKSDLSMVKKALYMYQVDYKSYPIDSAVSFGDPFPADGSYMKLLPLDPQNSGKFVYLYRQKSGGKNFCLYANLEIADDPDIAKSVTLCPDTVCPRGSGNYKDSYVICAD